jgi:hypothetical protein
MERCIHGVRHEERCYECLPKQTVVDSARPADIDSTLAQRESTYGNFAEHARITQAIKKAMRDSPNWERLDNDMKESLEMNAHKIGRILNGDPMYHDSWHDIEGYTKLVADRLKGEGDG